MKQRIKLFALALVLVAAGILCTGFEVHYGRKPVYPITIERLASHVVYFMDDDGEEFRSSCTMTAIGPHAFLTASHCNAGRDQSTKVRLDLSSHVYALLAKHEDDRDHIIYLIDGPEFKNYLYVKPGVGQSTITIYGFGGRHYPATPKFGKVIGCDDYSDLDTAQGEFCTDAPVIPGDSGAAVFNSKGEILGLVTYQGPGKGVNTNFSLAFTPEDYEFARTFVPTPEIEETHVHNTGNKKPDSELDRTIACSIFGNCKR